MWYISRTFVSLWHSVCWHNTAEVTWLCSLTTLRPLSRERMRTKVKINLWKLRVDAHLIEFVSVLSNRELDVIVHWQNDVIHQTWLSGGVMKSWKKYWKILYESPYNTRLIIIKLKPLVNVTYMKHYLCFCNEMFTSETIFNKKKSDGWDVILSIKPKMSSCAMTCTSINK